MRQSPRENDGPGATGELSTRLSEERRAGTRCEVIPLAFFRPWTVANNRSRHAGRICRADVVPHRDAEGFYSGLGRVGPRGDELVQLLEVEWLGQNRVTKLHQRPAASRVRPRISGDEDNLRRELGTMVLDPVLEVEAAFRAEPKIDERSVDRLAPEKLAGVPKGRGDVHGVSAAGEPGNHGPPNSSLVIDIEHGRHPIPFPASSGQPDPRMSCYSEVACGDIRRRPKKKKKN